MLLFIIGRLKFEEVVQFDLIREVPGIPGETVATKRLRIIRVLDELINAPVDVVGWASLTGRALDDQDPIMSILRMPDAHNRSTTEEPIKNRVPHENTIYHQQSRIIQKSVSQPTPGGSSNGIAVPVAVQAPRFPEASGSSTKNVHAEPFNCPICDMDISLFDIPARNHHINICTECLQSFDI
jgi:hypothetical protein